ncbi:MAG: Uma2 family endonuclease [Planctomycetaceae bacterium]|nr:Uma2 family endonuclease [Planctomycetaceae bacterium]
MSSLIAPERLSRSKAVPELYSGDQLSQREFHRRYEAYPEDTRFELVEGTVVMSSPVGNVHSRYHIRLSQVIATFEMVTEGVASASDGTVILSDSSEVQPDISLYLLPEFGGQTSLTRKGQYVQGAPEWVGEVSPSSVSIDLHQKKDAYQRAGVHEYFVLSVAEPKIHWFSFKSRRQIVPDSHGVYRSRAFPGLWIDGPALLAHDGKRLIRTLEAGLASREHAEFVQRLQSARKGK